MKKQHLKTTTLNQVARTTDDTCPHCNHKIRDLWDYDWTHSNYIEITCPHCNQEIAVTAEIYRIITPIRKSK